MILSTGWSLLLVTRHQHRPIPSDILRPWIAHRQSVPGETLPRSRRAVKWIPRSRQLEVAVSKLRALAQLEDLVPGLKVRGLLPDGAARVIHTQWHGINALTLTYADEKGRTGQQLLYRQDEEKLAVEPEGRAWSLEADGHLFRLASEAKRISLAYLFDPSLAVQTVLVDESDQGDISRVLVYLQHAIQDGRLDRSGQRRTVSRRFEFVEIDAPLRGEPLDHGFLFGHLGPLGGSSGLLRRELSRQPLDRGFLLEPSSARVCRQRRPAVPPEA